jgi:hypothetical protein
VILLCIDRRQTRRISGGGRDVLARINSCLLESSISQSREVPVQYPGGSGPVSRVASKAAHVLRSLIRISDDQQTRRQEKSVWGATQGYISRALGVAPSRETISHELYIIIFLSR